MFGKKDEKLETLKDLIGTRAGYMETVEILELKKDEHDLFMRASLEVKKSEPNLAIIDKAYAILVSKGFPEGDTAENTIAEEAVSDDISYRKMTSNSISWMKFAKPIVIFFMIVTIYNLIPFFIASGETLSIGKTNIQQPTCSVNGFGKGSCSFTNIGNTSGSVCGRYIVTNYRFKSTKESSILCSGEVKPKTTIKVDFLIHGMDNFCRHSQRGDWWDSCTFSWEVAE